MDEIPEDFTIRDMLAANRSEVLKMSIFEYNEAEHMAMEREEAREDGFLEGIAKGKAEIVKRIMDSTQISFEEACSLLRLTEEEISSCSEILGKDKAI